MASFPHIAFCTLLLLRFSTCSKFLIFTEGGWNCAHTRQQVAFIAGELKERHHLSLLVVSERARLCLERVPELAAARTLVYSPQETPERTSSHLQGDGSRCQVVADSLPRPLRSGDWPAYLEDLSSRLVCDCTSLFRDHHAISQIQGYDADVLVYDSLMPCAAYVAAWLGLPSVAMVTSLRPPTEDMFFRIPEPATDIPVHQSGLPRHMTTWQALHNAGSSWSLDAALQQLQASLDREVAWQVVRGHEDEVEVEVVLSGKAEMAAEEDVRAGTGLWAAARAWGTRNGVLDAMKATALVVIMADPELEVVPPLMPQHAKLVSPAVYRPTSVAPVNVGSSRDAAANEASAIHVDIQSDNAPDIRSTDSTPPDAASVPPRASLSTAGDQVFNASARYRAKLNASTSSAAHTKSLLVMVNSAMAHDPPRMRALTVAIARAARASSTSTTSSSMAITKPATKHGVNAMNNRHSALGPPTSPGVKRPNYSSNTPVGEEAAKVVTEERPRLSVTVAVEEDSVARVCCRQTGMKKTRQSEQGDAGQGSSSSTAYDQDNTDMRSRTCHVCHCHPMAINATSSSHKEFPDPVTCVPEPLMMPMRRLAEDLRRAGLHVHLMTAVVPQESLLSSSMVDAVVMGCAGAMWMTAAVYGVPALCLPMQGDENDGSQRVLEAGIGRRVLFRHSHRWPRVHEALVQVLFGVEVQANAQAVGRLLQPGPCAGTCQAADLLEDFTRRAVSLAQLNLPSLSTPTHSHCTRITTTGCLTTLLLACLGLYLWRNTPPLYAPWSVQYRPWHSRYTQRPQADMVEDGAATWFCHAASLAQRAVGGSNCSGCDRSPPASPSKCKPHKKTQSWTGS